MDPRETSSPSPAAQPPAGALVDRLARFAIPISAGAIVALCLLLGAPTLGSDQYFLGDDFGLVAHLHSVSLRQLLSYFTSDWTEGIYGKPLDELRPILAASYRLDAAVWGAVNVTGYHVTNVLLHALNALLVGAIALSLRPANRWIGLVAGTLFAVVPSHAEPISWISGRVDSLVALFYLGAFLCFVRFRSTGSKGSYGGSLLLFGAALFTKQSAVTFPVLLLAYDFVLGKAPRLARHAPFFGILAGYLVLRRALFGSALREDTLRLGMIKAFAFRQFFYMKSLLPVSDDYPRLVNWAIGLTLLAIGCVLIRWLLLTRSSYARSLNGILFFGPVWYVLTISPMVVAYESARHLYLTAAGLSIAAALLVAPAPLDRFRQRLLIFGLVMGLYFVAAARTIRPWVENGNYSARVMSELSASMSLIPAGSAVRIVLPEMRQNVYFWYFALPFALRPPFTAADVYSGYSIIEPANVYCCPPEQWWAKVRPILRSSADGPIFVVAPDPVTKSMVITEQKGFELKERAERVLSRRIDGIPFGIGPEDVCQVSRTLFSDAIR